MKYIAIIDYQINGHRVQIAVREFSGQEPSKKTAYNCDNSDDYYGYCDISFDLLDMDGTELPKLKNSLSFIQFDKIEQKVIDFFSE